MAWNQNGEDSNKLGLAKSGVQLLGVGPNKIPADLFRVCGQYTHGTKTSLEEKGEEKKRRLPSTKQDTLNNLVGVHFLLVFFLGSCSGYSSITLCAATYGLSIVISSRPHLARGHHLC